jgi:hypothetical protein
VGVTSLLGPAAASEEVRGTPQHPEAEVPEVPASSGQNKTFERIVQVIALAVILAAPALICVHRGVVADPDIWWHLRVGEWILQHHAVPRVAIFSAPLAGTPWLAYSWLFELVVVKLFYRLGLVGILAYTAGMIVAITAALYHLVRRLQGDFTLGVLFTFASLFSLLPIYTPRPWHFSILFFVLELDILMHVRKTGRLRELAWLPLIFALWANIHIEYIYGLFVLGLALVESVVARRSAVATIKVRVVWMVCALLASLLATLANPFGWRIYGVVYNLVTQGGGLRQVSEMQALPFRGLPDYCALLLTLAAAGALAWTRRFRLFESGLLLFAAVLSFRSLRDVWLVAVVAAAILASTITGRDRNRAPSPRFGATLATIAAALMVVAGFRVMKVNNAVLNEQVANVMPVRAVEAIRTNGYAGPLYNDFTWGGYLIWALRMPVIIDGRTNLYGNERMDRSIATWSAQPDWASDPELKSAGLIIGPATAPLTQVLRMDSHYKLVYEDKLAAVFVAQRGH